MSLSQNKSDRGQSGRTARTSALVAACILTVGSLSLTAPAEAAVTCAFDAATATLTLDKQDAVTIVRSGVDIVVKDDATGAVTCAGGTPTVTTTDVVQVTGADNDETVTIDLSGGGFSPGLTGTGIAFNVDLGTRRSDTVNDQGVRRCRQHLRHGQRGRPRHKRTPTAASSP